MALLTFLIREMKEEREEEEKGGNPPQTQTKLEEMGKKRLRTRSTVG